MKSTIINNAFSAEEFCNICPRQCNVDRRKSLGFCKSRGLRIARYGKHMWEEPIISGEEGSGTIFFSGCSLRCIYCQNYEVSQLSKGVDITTRQLADIFKKLEDDGANNINLVTPTHFVPQIIEALDIYKPNIPICYNTGGYEIADTLKRLDGYVDIFLADFKYWDAALAEQLSKAGDYPEVARKALLKMRDMVKRDEFDGRGMMTKGVIVRHLVLPNAVQNSKDVLDFIATDLGRDTIVSIMSQYTPCGAAVGHPVFGRRLKPLEYKIVVNYALKLGLDNAYVQEFDSADNCYIPKFFGERLDKSQK